MGNTLTEEKRKKREKAFIEKAMEVQHGKYSYDHFVFVNTHTKGWITCPIHGDFLQTPKNHLQGQGCPICGKEYAQQWSKNNYSHFLKRAEEEFGKNFSYPNIEKEYENNHSKITIKCNTCGHIFTKRAGDHLNSLNGGCSVCYKKSFEKYYTYEELLVYNKLNLNIKSFEGKKEYRDKCTVICPKHGEYEIIINSILKGKGKCGKCASKKATTALEFRRKFIKKYGDILEWNDNDYINMSKEIIFTCKKCGHKFKRSPTAVLNYKYKDICPECSIRKISEEKTKSTEQFKLDVEKVYGKGVFDMTDTVYIKSSEYVTLKCNECGRYFTKEANSLLQGNGCPYHYLNSSKSEDEIADFIKERGFTVTRNNRTILENRHELDIYIPDKQLAIEFDGIFWHNEINKPVNYHLNKTEECNKKGIKLIHIFEDEWLDKPNIWKSMLNNLLGLNENRIFARKCEIKEVSMENSKTFLEENHLQGYCHSQIRYGLYYNDELVSLMTFGKTRHFIGNSSHQFELLRFCNKLNTSVIGAASRLFKYFIKTVKPNNIVSYADKRWSNGNLYEKLRFHKYNESKPNYYYVIGNRRKNRFNFRKSILVKKYNCPQDMSEHEFCKSKGWYRIYDCGCLCYEWNSSN